MVSATLREDPRLRPSLRRTYNRLGFRLVRDGEEHPIMYVSRKLQSREGELDHKVGGAQAKVPSVGQTIHLGDQSPTTEMDALKQKQESQGAPMVPGTPGL